VVAQHQPFNNDPDSRKEAYVDGRELHAAFEVSSQVRLGSALRCVLQPWSSEVYR
jgi:hypothetical protein